MTARQPQWLIRAMRRGMPANVREHMEWAEAAGLTVKTLEARGDILRRVTFEVGDLDTLTTAQLAGWISNPDWGTQTRATYGNHLRGYYRWSVDTDRLPADPMRKIPVPRVSKGLPRPVTEAELASVLATATGAWRLAVLIAAYAGLRCMELVALTRADITADTIHIRHGKGGKEAMLPCHRLIWEAVKDLPDGPILHRPGYDRPFKDPRELAVYAGRWFRENGYPTVTMHRFRHRYGTQVYRKTKDLLLTSRMLRHSSVQTTVVYTLLDDDAGRDAIDLL